MSRGKTNELETAKAGHHQPDWETNELPQGETNELETAEEPDTTVLWCLCVRRGSKARLSPRRAVKR